MTTALERLNSGRRRKLPASSTITIERSHLIAAALMLTVAGVAWGAGMRMGYVYAKRDAAYVLETSNPDPSVALPAWRAWADASVAYTPPADLGLIFDITARTIPGTGGMTTGDIWNGYHDRLKRAYFDRTAEPRGDILPVPTGVSEGVARTADEPAAGY